MKKILTTCLIYCTSLLCADNAPVFEKNEQNSSLKAYACPAFSLSGDEKEKEETVAPANEHESSALEAPRASWQNPSFNPQTSYSHWHRFHTEYGRERLVLRFPHNPNVTRTGTMVKAQAHDGFICYSLDGYFPPTPNIIPSLWFDQLLAGCNTYPFVLKSYKTQNPEPGVFIMDYIAHDVVQNTTVKARAIATPLNGYILQCYKPNGLKDAFRYFVEHCSIHY